MDVPENEIFGGKNVKPCVLGNSEKVLKCQTSNVLEANVSNRVSWEKLEKSRKIPKKSNGQQFDIFGVFCVLLFNFFP